MISQYGKLFTYSPSKDVTLQRNELCTQQNLLTEKEDHRQHHIGKNNMNHHVLKDRNVKKNKINFLQQWQVSRYLPPQNVQTYKRSPFNLQKQKNTYIRKMQIQKVQQAISQTKIHDGCLELINYSIAQMDIDLYLQQWQQLQVIKLVKVNMSDNQLNFLLNYMSGSEIHTIVLSGNNLTEISLDAFLNYTKREQKLKNIYISKNNINTIKGNSRQKINLLRQKGINLYI